MTMPELAQWFKTTILGIILLGAAGSILAVWLGRYLFPPLARAMGWPFGYHKSQRHFQAFLLGWAHRSMHDDDTARRTMTFMSYHVLTLLR